MLYRKVRPQRGENDMLALTKKTGYGLIAMTHLYGLQAGAVASAREIAASA